MESLRLVLVKKPKAEGAKPQPVAEGQIQGLFQLGDSVEPFFAVRASMPGSVGMMSQILRVMQESRYPLDVTCEISETISQFRGWQAKHGHGWMPKTIEKFLTTETPNEAVEAPEQPNNQQAGLPPVLPVDGTQANGHAPVRTGKGRKGTGRPRK
jgi:hypothetical protein